VTAALTLRVALEGFFVATAPLLFLVLAVLVSSHLAGVRAGLIATGLSLLVGWYAFDGRPYTFDLPSYVEAIRLVSFSLIGASISILNERLRRGHVRAAEALARATASERDARAAQARAEAARTALEVTFDSLTEAVMVLGHSGEKLTANPAFAKLYGFASPADVFSRLTDYPNLFEACSIEGKPIPAGDWPIVRALRGETVKDYVMRVRRTDTGKNWIASYSAAPVYDSAGRLLQVVVTIHDMTAGEWARQQLEESEKRYRDLYENAPDMYCSVDPATGLVLQCNQTLLGLTGFSRDEVVGRHVLERYHPSCAAAARRCFEQFLEHGEIHDSELALRRKDGSLLYVSLSVSALRDENGHVLRGRLVCRDITERKRAREALRESEARYRTLLASVPQLIWTCLPNGYCDFLSPQWLEYTGVPESEQLGYLWLDVLHPEDRPRAFQAWRDAVEDRAEYDLEYRIRGRDGAYRWFKTRGSPLRDEAGQIVRWFGTCTDIDLVKRTEEALRESQSRLAMATRAGNLGLFDWDLASGSVHWTEEQEKLFGIAPGTFEGTQEAWMRRVHPEDVKEVMTAFKACAAGHQERMEFAYRALLPDASTRWLEGSARLLYGHDGQPVRLVGVCVDVTERRLSEQALRRNNEELKQFAYAASHDLQEPLRTVISYTQLLTRNARGKLAPEEKRFMQFIVESSERMMDLIRDLREYLEVSGDGSEQGPVDLNQTLATVLQNLQVAIRESGAAVSQDTLPVVLGKEAHFLQLLQNLLSNGMKYRRDGVPPVLHVSARRMDNEWEFSVRDNGQGIAREYWARVFGVFKRLHGKSIPGTGIGLALCQRVVERYGGRIWLDSEPGAGSTFFFTLPFTAIRETSAGF
jgi:PAS domain S-box-containing protein